MSGGDVDEPGGEADDQRYGDEHDPTGQPLPRSDFFHDLALPNNTAPREPNTIVGIHAATIGCNICF